MRSLLLALLLPFATAFNIAPIAVRKSYSTSRAAVVTMADAPQMAEGATTVAIVGGLATILLAGIPVLFLSGQGNQDSKAERAAGLEAGLKSEMSEAAFQEAMMEEVAEADLPPEDDDGAPKKSQMI